LTIAAAVASGKPRTSGLSATPSFTQITLASRRQHPQAAQNADNCSRTLSVMSV
jgi:hypothetical protein